MLKKVFLNKSDLFCPIVACGMHCSKQYITNVLRTIVVDYMIGRKCFETNIQTLCEMHAPVSVRAPFCNVTGRHIDCIGV